MPESMMEDSFEYIQSNFNNNEQYLNNFNNNNKPGVSTSVKQVPVVRKQQQDENKIQKTNSTFHFNSDNINNRANNKLWQRELNLISLENVSHNKDLVTYQYIKKVVERFF